jgi:hypothetical protein
LPLPPYAKATAKIVVGFALAVALWVRAAPAYHVLLVDNVRRLTHAFSGPSTAFALSGSDLVVSDSDILSKSASLSLAVVSANVVLLLTLFAAGPWIGRAVLRALVALVLNCLTNLLGTAIGTQSLLATQFGPWSDRHYSALAQNLWFLLWQGYELVGTYGIVFGLWWLLRVRDTPAGVKRSRSRRESTERA